MKNTEIIILAAGVFLAVTLILVSLLLWAKKKLAPGGRVKIKINDDRILDVDSGSSLLSTLGSEKIFLPSACGGQGTCGMCKCRVISGGGAVLPTETPYFTRGQIKDSWRLACQVKVRSDMDILVPEEIFGIKKWECEVVSNYNVATFIKAFVVKLPEGENLKFRAGGYVQIDVPAVEVDYRDIDISPAPDDPAGPDKYKSDWDAMHLWDLRMVNPEPVFRAYSMANHPAEGNIIMLTVRIATPPYDAKAGGFMKVNPGICSSYIFSRKPGDKITVSGPYGEFFINEKSDAEMVYIGGGAGMAPLRSHIMHLLETEHSKRKITFYYGGRSRKELFFEKDFRELEKKYPNFKFYEVLSSPEKGDDWKVKKSADDPEGDGFIGFVHDAVIKNHLQGHPAPEDIEFYFCGPPMMNKAVVKMCDDWGVPRENVHYDDFGS